MTPAFLAIMQVEASPLASNTLRMFIITAIFLAVVVTAMVFAFKFLRRQRDNSGTTQLRAEFEKTKEGLLAAAMAKKQAADREAGNEREQSAEDKERELLRENVDPHTVFGQNCPLCSLELAEDEELVIDPYTGAGYHLSCFLNAWPLGDDGRPLERPKFVYRYPQGTVVRSNDLIRTF